jgi:hypothetical protein
MDLSLLDKPPFVQYSETSQYFMEPEGSFPCSQESSTSPILSQINPISKE